MKDSRVETMKQALEPKPGKDCRSCCTKCPVKLAHEETWKNGVLKDKGSV